MKDTLLGSVAIEWLGVHYKIILRTADTGGAISVTDSVSPPNSGPPRHVHHNADETFVVLTGDVEFWMEGARFARDPGQSFSIPRSNEHTFRIVSDTPSRHLVVLTPGGFEGFFAEMAEGQYAISDVMPKIAESAARFDMNFTGPPLGSCDAEDAP